MKKQIILKSGSALFLKIVIICIAIGALTGMILIPPSEGRAANLSVIDIYKDPFLIYAYIGFIPFFVALFQAIKLLGHIEKNKIFTQASVKTVKTIKYCALAFIAFLIGAMFYIRFMLRGDDPAGPTMIALIAVFISIAIATGAGVFQRLLQNAIDIKSENDLTV